MLTVAELSMALVAAGWSSMHASKFWQLAISGLVGAIAAYLLIRAIVAL